MAAHAHGEAVGRPTGQLADLDFTTQAAELEVPVYLLVGRYDANAMTSLVERYQATLPR